MSSELIKLNTRGYNSDLDKLTDNKVDVYLKAKLTKRLTYGEYVGEPKNGFELLIGDERKTLNLDNVEVVTCKDKPSLTDDQQEVLEWLQIYADKDSGDKPFQTIFFLWDCIKSNNLGNVELSALRKLTRAEQFQVLAAFAEWGMANA